MGPVFGTFDRSLVVEGSLGAPKVTVWGPELDDGKHREVIEVALGKRKLVERSEEEGVWGRWGPGGETLYGFFAKRGSFFRRSFDNF